MQKRFASYIALVILILPLFALAQTPRKSFEVASIKPNTSGRCCTSMLWPAGRFSATSVTVSDLLVFAYSPPKGPTLQKDVILGGPRWLDSDRFDIQAKPESGESKETMQLMMRSLLEDRFHLKLHLENRELPVYNLIVVKDGLKMKSSEDQSPPNSQPPAPSATAGAQGNRTPRGSYGMSSDSSVSTLEGAAVPLSALVSMLQGQAGRPVIDKTDLKGLFDFRLEFSPNALEVNAPELQQQARPSLFSALQEQLGLKLEAAKGPGEVLVIDHVEKPSEN
ncbi:MAG: hypothetical protein DMG14_23375 [Acidobacteria bacterium]|nr:MAG: hypothetical protein DMG14_23375 [Acidobacteriota bacterium]